jgi:hypothetical protein
MATQAQNIANSANAQHSTGPKSEAGKLAVARNSLSHGLSSNKFAVLPHEDAAEFENLRCALHADFAPGSTAEIFLVEELARAQWKLQRVAAMEQALFGSEGDLTRWFKEDCSKDEVLLKLSRYEGNARRAWYKALAELRKIRSERSVQADRHARTLKAQAEHDFHKMMERELAIPMPMPVPPPAEPNCKTKPMPAHLVRELERHKRRNPDFEPDLDRSQMSKELRRWFFGR